MTDEMMWIGLAREQVQDIGARYEQACAIALERARENHPGDGNAAAPAFIEMRRGIRRALAEELGVLGCPASERADWAVMIVNSAVHHRIRTPPVLSDNTGEAAAGEACPWRIRTSSQKRIGLGTPAGRPGPRRSGPSTRADVRP